MPENEQKHDQVKPFSKLIKVSIARLVRANFIHMASTENVGSYRAFVLSFICTGLDWVMLQLKEKRMGMYDEV